MLPTLLTSFQPLRLSYSLKGFEFWLELDGFCITGRWHAIYLPLSMKIIIQTLIAGRLLLIIFAEATHSFPHDYCPHWTQAPLFSRLRYISRFIAITALPFLRFLRCHLLTESRQTVATYSILINNINTLNILRKPFNTYFQFTASSSNNKINYFLTIRQAS